MEELNLLFKFLTARSHRSPLLHNRKIEKNGKIKKIKIISHIKITACYIVSTADTELGSCKEGDFTKNVKFQKC